MNPSIRRLAHTVFPVVLALGVGLTDSPAGATERWVPLGPSGGMIRLLAQGTSDPARLYAVTENSGQFVSRDAGSTWTAIRSGGSGWRGGYIQRLVVAPNDPDFVLAATSGDFPWFYQVWRSVDGGLTWAAATVPPQGDGESLPAQDLLFDPGTPTTAYAATDRGIFRTLDGGSTWESWALPDVETGTIAYNPQAPATWFASGLDRFDFHGAIFRSDDGGATWRETPPSPFGVAGRLFFRSRALYSRQGNTLYRSTDGAATWQLAAHLTTLDPFDFEISPSGRIYAATETGVYSTDDGTNWSRPEVHLPELATPKDAIFALALVPGGPRPDRETVIGGGRRGVWRSTDRGLSWRASSRGIAAHSVDSLIVIPDREGTVLGAFDYGISGLYRIDREGTSWQVLPPQTGFESPALAADPHHPGRVYALGPFGAIGVSEDRGNSWVKLAQLRSDTPELLLVDPVHPDVIYAGVRDGLGSRGEDLAYKSVDGGVHWSKFLDDGLSNLIFDPHRPDVGFRLTYSGLDKTTDGGRHWARLSGEFQGSDPVSILYDAGSRTLYVGTEDRGVFRSTDSGRTFRRIAAGLPRLAGGQNPAVVTLIQDAAGEFYAALSSSGVFRLKPGQGWTAVNLDLPLGRFAGLLIADPEIPGRLYAGTFGSSVLRLENR